MEDEFEADIPGITVAEFRRLGLLQEINRQFLHPMGLALSVVLEEDGSESFGELWDYRSDPEGLIFGSEAISKEKADWVEQMLKAKEDVRKSRFGWHIQPVKEDK